MARKKKITRLTKEQEATLAESVASWLAIGRSTERCDRESCEAAWAGLYAKIGESPPMVLWFDSPLACILAWGILSQLDSQLDSQLRSQLDSQLGSQLRSQLRSQLYSQLDSQLGSQLYSQLGSQLGSQLDSQLGSQLYSQLDSQLSVRWAGGWWSWFPAFYSWPEIHLADQGFTYEQEASACLALWRQDAENAHWWFPYKPLILASDRPTVLTVDAEGRLHGETGPALQYADGYSLYAWHGVRLDDRRVIEKPHSLTAPEVLGEQNVEVRRVMIERFGYDRLLDEAQAELLDADMDELGNARELRRIPLPDDEDIVAVRVVNSTAEPDGSGARQYLLRVPPTITTCQAAVAWTFDVPEGDYQLAAQT